MNLNREHAPVIRERQVQKRASALRDKRVLLSTWKTTYEYLAGKYFTLKCLG
jgi:hypothetical protein